MTVGQTNDGLKQASVRAVTSTTENYEGDWHALFTLASIPAGPFDQRLLAWLNIKLSATYTNLPAAMQALATSLGIYNWSSIGTFDASTGGGGTAGSPIGLLLALTKAA